MSYGTVLPPILFCLCLRCSMDTNERMCHLKSDGFAPDVLLREVAVVILGMHTIGRACRTPEFSRMYCMRLSLFTSLHASLSLYMCAHWEGTRDMGERDVSYCSCACGRSGMDRRGKNGKSRLMMLRRRALRGKRDFLRRKQKRTRGSIARISVRGLLMSECKWARFHLPRQLDPSCMPCYVQDQMFPMC